MNEKKLPNGMKIVFAPGCFDNFEGTQEELDALVKEIESGFSDGSFFDKAVPLDESIEDLTEEEYLELHETMEEVKKLSENKRNLQ